MRCRDDEDVERYEMQSRGDVETMRCRDMEMEMMRCRDDERGEDERCRGDER